MPKLPLEVQSVTWLFRFVVVINMLLGVACITIFNQFIEFVCSIMSSLSNLIRLGITRNWRLRLVNQNRVYAASLIHCMLLYLLLRAKAFRLGLWVVLYYIVSSLKKYVIHLFFWKLIGVKKKHLSNAAYSVKLVTARRRSILGELSTIRVRVLPTNIRLGFFWRYSQIKSTSRKSGSKISTKSRFKLSNLWQPARGLLAWWVRAPYNFKRGIPPTPKYLGREPLTGIRLKHAKSITKLVK